MLAHGALSRLQEPPWIEAQAIRDLLDGLEGEIPLAALDAAEVGPVYADEFSEVLLRPVGYQNSITPLTSGFLLAHEGPDRCLSRLVQNLISRRSFRIHSASCGTLLRTRGSAA